MLNLVSQGMKTLLVSLAILSLTASNYSSVSAQVSQSTRESDSYKQTQICSDEAARGYVNKLGSPELSNSEFNALVACGSQATSPLVMALENEHSEVRASAAYALGQIGSDAYTAVPTLISALDDPYLDVRLLAAYALGQIGSRADAAVPRLSRTLRHLNEDLDVRNQAADALRNIGTEEAIAVLRPPTLLRLPNAVPLHRGDGLGEQASLESLWNLPGGSLRSDSTSNQSAIASQISTNLPLVCRIPGISSILPRCR